LADDHSIRANPAAKAFVSTATRFCILLEHPVRERDLWLADLLNTLAAVYASAPHVRDIPLPDGGDPIPQDFRLTNDEWNALYTHLKHTLAEQGGYQAHFSPTTAAATDEPAEGDLADDLADIYRDLKPGLSAWATGDDRFLGDVLYQWVHYGHVHHWGRHAVNAMRALHELVHK
jgi:hypothetical protein